MSEILSGPSPVTGLSHAGLPLYAIVVGDPDRVPWVAGHLGKPLRVPVRREYVAHRGRWQGTELHVIAHGVGTPGAQCALTTAQMECPRELGKRLPLGYSQLLALPHSLWLCKTA